MSFVAGFRVFVCASGLLMLVACGAAEPEVLVTSSDSVPSEPTDTSVVVDAVTTSTVPVASTAGSTVPAGSAVGSTVAVGSATTSMVPVSVTDPATTVPSGSVAFTSSLVGFDSCAAFERHLRGEAAVRVGPYGFDAGPSSFPVGVAEEAFAADQMVAASTMAGAVASVEPVPVLGVDYSGTNVQELGVDEPDYVKTDGSRVMVLKNGFLYYVDVSSGGAELMGSLDLWASWSRQEREAHFSSAEMLLYGDSVLLVASGYRGWDDITVLTVVDISDPGDLVLGDVLEVDGRYVSARLSGGKVTLVTVSYPGRGLDFVYPHSVSGEVLAQRVNREVVESSTLDDWVPRYRLVTDSGPGEGRLLDCGSAYAPSVFSGLDLVSVLSFDFDEGLDPEAVTTVVSGGDLVYASESSLYVATESWVDWVSLDEEGWLAAVDSVTTFIHRFDISGSGSAEYLASGSVEGFLLNQFSMSEFDGFLRVASTDMPARFWWGPRWGGDRRSVSRVDVLEQVGKELRVVGSVGGLGFGERIYAVRFLGDVGYVVTFRETDPLYTVDLSDPYDPRVVGELKILGYSAYLHPVGDGLLLGVGQDADERGWRLGTQLSLFDVSDLANPVRVAAWSLGDGSDSSVEWDHKAFLWWPAEGLAVVPVVLWDAEEWDYYGSGVALVFSVSESSVESVASVEHRLVVGSEGVSPEFWLTDPPLRINRSLVVGDLLFTFSEGGMLGSDLGSFEPVVWVELGDPQQKGLYVWPEPLEG